MSKDKTRTPWPPPRTILGFCLTWVYTGRSCAWHRNCCEFISTTDLLFFTRGEGQPVSFQGVIPGTLTTFQGVAPYPRLFRLHKLLQNQRTRSEQGGMSGPGGSWEKRYIWSKFIVRNSQTINRAPFKLQGLELELNRWSTCLEVQSPGLNSQYCRDRCDSSSWEAKARGSEV